ncbi:MAG: protein serine/threonine phosphatase 2C family protein [Proteobacteria bacterium]|nr:protein serine/threonine phosphatase 2C family protein [Pseudomonadota bacterium]
MKKIGLFIVLGSFVLSSYSAQSLQRIARASRLAAFTLENTRGPKGSSLYPNQDRCFFKKLPSGQLVAGVFDGHGKHGDFVSQFLQAKALENFSKSFLAPAEITQFYSNVNQELKHLPFAHKSGSTACIALLDNKTLTVSHVGDSRLLVMNNLNILFTTQDHKPSLLRELKAIEKAGGLVKQGRVINPGHNASLAISRSLGDCAFGPVISRKPEISQITLETGALIVMATDGLFDVMGNQQVAEFISQELSYGNDLKNIAQSVAQEARALGSDDDITVQLIQL